MEPEELLAFVELLGAPLIAQLFDETTALMRAAETLVQQQLTPR
jgi:hypothetical protein